MKNLFLDSNIWLDLYYFSSNDLEEFSKLNDMLNKDIKLYMPQQVVCEIQRNRDAKIIEAYKKFKDFKIQMPNLCMGYSEFVTFNKLYKDIQVVHKDLCIKVEKDISGISLPADKLVNNVYKNTTIIPEDEATANEAYRRYIKGNPPGKNNSYGDAIIWLSLLNAVPNKEDLFFVSADKDYQSAIDENRMDLFLITEWKNKKESNIFYYKSLVQFLREHVKDINLVSEKNKESAIEALAQCGTFKASHSAIRDLRSYNYFSDDQINEIINIAANNGQVYSIIEDDDIMGFFKELTKNKEAIIKINDENSFILKKIGIKVE